MNQYAFFCHFIVLSECPVSTPNAYSISTAITQLLRIYTCCKYTYDLFSLLNCNLIYIISQLWFLHAEPFPCPFKNCCNFTTENRTYSKQSNHQLTFYLNLVHKRRFSVNFTALFHQTDTCSFSTKSSSGLKTEYTVNNTIVF